MNNKAAQENWRKMQEAKRVPQSDKDNGHGIPYRILLDSNGNEYGKIPVNGRFTGTRQHKENFALQKNRS